MRHNNALVRAVASSVINPEQARKNQAAIDLLNSWLENWAITSLTLCTLK
jgi:hypothetical protein